MLETHSHHSPSFTFLVYSASLFFYFPSLSSSPLNFLCLSLLHQSTQAKFKHLSIFIFILAFLRLSGLSLVCLTYFDFFCFSVYSLCLSHLNLALLFFIHLHCLSCLGKNVSVYHDSVYYV